MQYSIWSVLRTEQRGRNTSSLLTTLLFRHPRIQLASGLQVCTQLMFSFSSTRTHKLFSTGASLFEFFFQSLLMSGIAVTQMQSPVFRLVELHQVFMSPLLKFVQVPLDFIPSLCCFICNAYLHVACNLLLVHSLSMSLMKIFPQTVFVLHFKTFKRNSTLSLLSQIRGNSCHMKSYQYFKIGNVLSLITSSHCVVLYLVADVKILNSELSLC